jgi:hypothetical protein
MSRLSFLRQDEKVRPTNHKTFPTSCEGGGYKWQDRISTRPLELEKERGPRLGTRAPKDAFRFPVFF